MAPSTPPPPRRPELAALTIASACTLTISPCMRARVTPLMVRVDIKISPLCILQQQAERLFQQAFEFLQETSGDCAIDDAVVGRECDFHTVAHHDLSIDNYGSWYDGTDSQDSGLGRVDDGCKALHLEHAQVADRESAAGELFRAQLACTSRLGQTLRLARNIEQAALISIANDRNDQSLFKSDRHADVDLLLLQDAVLGEGDVDLGHTHKGFGNGLDNQVVETDLDLIGFGCSVGVYLLAQFSQLAGIDYAGDVEVRRGLHALTEPLRNGAAHCGERYFDDLARFDYGSRYWLWSRLWSGGHRGGRLHLDRLYSRLRGLSQGRLDIQFDNAPVGAGSTYLAIIKLVFCRDTPGDWRDEDAPIFACWCGSRGLRGMCCRTGGRRFSGWLRGKGWRDIVGFVSWLTRRCGCTGGSARFAVASLAVWKRLVWRTNERDASANRRGLPLRHQDFTQHTASKSLDLNIDLVGFDLRQELAFLDGVSFVFEPAKNLAFFHCIAHLGHFYGFHASFSLIDMQGCDDVAQP